MISIENLSVQAGDFSLAGISFEIPTGAHGILMGRTGCGKTTVLEAICGLKEVTAGTIRLMDRDVTTLRAGERGIGFVPQDGALFTTMTVHDHLAFGPRIQRWKTREIKERVAQLAALPDGGLCVAVDPGTEGVALVLAAPDVGLEKAVTLGGIGGVVTVH